MVTLSVLGLVAAGCGQAEAKRSAAETKSEIVRLTEEVRALPDLRRTNEEVAQLRKENEELPALRNQYRQLEELQKENDLLRERLARTNQGTGAGVK